MIPDVDVLIALVRETARAELLPRFAHAERRFKDDGSIVTSADLAVQDRLAAALASLTPSIPLLAEEMTEARQTALIRERRHFSRNPMGRPSRPRERKIGDVDAYGGPRRPASAREQHAALLPRSHK